MPFALVLVLLLVLLLSIIAQERSAARESKT